MNKYLITSVDSTGDFASPFPNALVVELSPELIEAIRWAQEQFIRAATSATPRLDQIKFIVSSAFWADVDEDGEGADFSEELVDQDCIKADTIPDFISETSNNMDEVTMLVSRGTVAFTAWEDGVSDHPVEYYTQPILIADIL